MERLLAVDIGNTNIMLGVFSGAEVTAHYRLATEQNKTPDEYRLLIQNILKGGETEIPSMEMAILCSVVPRLTPTVSEAVTHILGIEPLVVNHNTDMGIKVLYDNPSEVGPDRLVNAVAAAKLHPLPAIVVDFGTATTYDVISREREYLGGIICPGVETSAADLFHRASRLAPVELTFPGKVIGKNTADSLRAGILLQASTSLEGIVKLVEQELAERATVIATGGLAPTICALTERVDVLDRLFTLKGLQIIAKKVAKRGEP